MPPQAAPFWLCHECGAQMRPLMVDGVPHCASCNSDFLEILDEEVNPDPHHELPHPPTRPGEAASGPPAVPPRPDAAPRLASPDVGNPVGGFLSSVFDTVFGRLDDPRSNAGSRSGTPSGPPLVPPRPEGGGDPRRTPGARTRTYNWGGASFTITTGSAADIFGGPTVPPGNRNPNPWVGGQAGAPGNADDGLDAYFRGFGAPPPNRPGRGMGTEDASGAIFLQALFDMLAEDGGATGLFPAGRFGDYVMTEDGYNDILERLMQVAGPQGPLPATDAVIEGLPRFAFADCKQHDQFKDCPICMEDFVETDTVVQLPCKHLFHPDCVVPWLKSNGSCPVCRFSLVSEEGPRAGGAQTETQQAAPGAPAENRGPLGVAQEFISSALNRLWGQSGAASQSRTESRTESRTHSGAATPATDQSATDDARQQFDAAMAHVRRATEAERGMSDEDRAAEAQRLLELERASRPRPSEPSEPRDYRPGVFPGTTPHVPPRRFVRRQSSLSESFTADEDSRDPEDHPLPDRAPTREAPSRDQGPREPVFAISGMSPGLSSAIPADYRARHAAREREMERERNGGHPYWDDDVD